MVQNTKKNFTKGLKRMLKTRMVINQKYYGSTHKMGRDLKQKQNKNNILAQLGTKRLLLLPLDSSKWRGHLLKGGKHNTNKKTKEQLDRDYH